MAATGKDKGLDVALVSQSAFTKITGDILRHEMGCKTIRSLMCRMRFQAQLYSFAEIVIACRPYPVLRYAL